MPSNAPILVTGSHRSGSTWVGRTLAQARGVSYIHEPFGLHSPPSIRLDAVRWWFHQVQPEEEATFARELGRTLAFEHDVRRDLRSDELDVGEKARSVRRAARFARARWGRHRPLMKDPLALFSAPWLADTFDMDVVVLVRHPAAFVSSLKRLGWTFPFEHFRDQPGLMTGELALYAADVAEAAERPPALLEQGILLWNLIHERIDAYRRDHEDWLVRRHEDLSLDPVGGFRDLYDRLDLTWTEGIEAGIRAATGRTNPRDAPEGGDTLQRDSRANVTNWKRRLDQEEIERVKEVTRPVWTRFYTEDEW